MDASDRTCRACHAPAAPETRKSGPEFGRDRNHREHEHEHEHEEDQEQEQEQEQETAELGESAGGVRRQLAMIVSAGALFVTGLVTEHVLHHSVYRLIEYPIFLSAYLLVGRKVVRSAVRNLVRGELFDEAFLMTVATLGAILIHQLPEAVAVMLFYAVGELFQDAAVGRSRRAIRALLAIRPDVANVKIGDRVETVRPGDVEVGQVVLVRPGERVPLDGEVIRGSSFVDTSALTGEPTPRRVRPGEKVLAGMVNQGGTLDVRVERRSAESAVSRILNLMENAAARKAPTEQFITRFARYYTPVVTLAALGVALIPPLVVPGATLATWVYRALVLLVISCPCALVISIPLGYFGGIGGASRHGILVKGANFLDALTSLHTVVFDKTGTLTKGVFRVTGISVRNGYSRDELLELAALAETNSAHPIGKSILEAYGRPVRADLVRDYQEISGHGVRALVDGKEIIAGNDRLMHRENIDHDSCDLEGTVVYVAVNRVFAGYIVISDEVKPDAAEAVAGLRRLGVRRAVMLTGDDEAVAKVVAERTGMDAYFAELLPEEKVAKLEEIESAMPGLDGRKLAFVGDGINDAPVIARADVGIAMGGLGRDAAIEAADVVIMDDMPSRLVMAVRIARSTRAAVVQNIALALSVKGAFILLGAVGVATMWEAVFADVGVALLAIVNSTRVLRRDFGRGVHAPR
ncbi:MAG: Zn2+/Cd2+-exporting ATPase [Bacillota bacterium]|nr:Zn2+/Cd2+-exporting ATPase [Bacillota bacterium]